MFWANGMGMGMPMGMGMGMPFTPLAAAQAAAAAAVASAAASSAAAAAVVKQRQQQHQLKQKQKGLSRRYADMDDALQTQTPQPAAKPKEATGPETCVIPEAGGFRAEIGVYVKWTSTGDATRERAHGPLRRTKREALKDCIELRAMALKSGADPMLAKLRQRSEELEDVTWTEVHLGGRQLDGAESHPREVAALKAAPAAPSRPKKTSEGPSLCCLEVADLAAAVARQGLVAWESKVKVALQQLFKKFGPVLEVKLLDGDDPVAMVRFAAARAADSAMAAAKTGVLQLGEAEVRVRQPASEDRQRRDFAEKRSLERPEEEQPDRKSVV